MPQRPLSSRVLTENQPTWPIRVWSRYPGPKGRRTRLLHELVGESETTMSAKDRYRGHMAMRLVRRLLFPVAQGATGVSDRERSVGIRRRKDHILARMYPTTRPLASCATKES